MFRWLYNSKSTISSTAQLQAGGSETDRYFGLENLGNTCYANSVLQALYFCKPFRDCCIAYQYPIRDEALSVPKNYQRKQSVTRNQNVSSTDELKLNNNVERKKSFGEVVFVGEGLKKKLSQGKWLNRGNQLQQIQQQIIDDSNDLSSFLLSVLNKENKENSPLNDDTLLSCLHDLFIQTSSQKKKTGSHSPLAFITKLKKENELFDSTMHQDAHEFLNYTLNSAAEILVGHQKEIREKLKVHLPPPLPTTPMHYKVNGITPAQRVPITEQPPKSWIHELFEGIFINETKCLTCDSVTSKDESFLDLSIDVEEHTSLSSCLRNFSKSEILGGKNKFFCDSCRSLQEAEKRMKIKKLPNILAVHLKRFKYVENLQRYVKLSHRVVFPMELKLFNTIDDAPNADRLYTLTSIVIHIGNGPYMGHYISLVKSGSLWIIFDDDNVEVVDEGELSKYFGDVTSIGTGYIFLYQAENFDNSALVSSMQVEKEETSPSPANSSTKNEILEEGSSSPTTTTTLTMNNNIPITTITPPSGGSTGVLSSLLTTMSPNLKKEDVANSSKELDVGSTSDNSLVQKEAKLKKKETKKKEKEMQQQLLNGGIGGEKAEDASNNQWSWPFGKKDKRESSNSVGEGFKA